MSDGSKVREMTTPLRQNWYPWAPGCGFHANVTVLLVSATRRSSKSAASAPAAVASISAAKAAVKESRIPRYIVGGGAKLERSRERYSYEAPATDDT